MGFEVFTPPPVARGRKQGPPRVTVTTASNGRTTLRFSAAARDHLQPTPRPEGAPTPFYAWPKLTVILLVDREEGRVAIGRVSDDSKGPQVYEARGLATSAYIGDWRLNEALGLVDGRYPVELTTLEGSRAVILTLGQYEPTTPPTRDAQQISTIDAILNEGVEIVGKEEFR